MEEKLESYLGSRYHEIDWRDAKSVLFSGDGDDTLALENLRALKAKYTAASPCFSGPSGSSISGSSSIPTCLSKKTPASKSRVRKLRKRSRIRWTNLCDEVMHWQGECSSIRSLISRQMMMTMMTTTTTEKKMAMTQKKTMAISVIAGIWRTDHTLLCGSHQDHQQRTT